MVIFGRFVARLHDDGARLPDNHNRGLILLCAAGCIDNCNTRYAWDEGTVEGNIKVHILLFDLITRLLTSDLISHPIRGIKAASTMFVVGGIVSLELCWIIFIVAVYYVHSVAGCIGHCNTRQL